jgi:hypothetical protein
VAPLPTTPANRDAWALRGAACYSDGPVLGPAGTTATIGEREVRLAIPFLDPAGLDIAVASEEVVVRLGQQRRHLLLPGLVEGGRLRARVEGEILRLWID